MTTGGDPENKFVSNLKMVKFEPTTPNMSQHRTTGWPNARNILRAKMLRYLALICCDRLAGTYALIKIRIRLVGP